MEGPSRNAFRLLAAVLLLVLHSGARAQFTDDFSDGDFTQNPVWNGNAGLFTVVDDGGNQRLRSNSPGAATYHLSTASTLAADAQWEFFVDLRFATSGANLVDIYLMSPQADLNPRPEGYFVRIGDTPDHIVLYRRTGTTNTALVQSPNGTVGSNSSNPFRIRVTRDLDDLWTLAYQPGGAGPWTTAGTATDNTFSSCTHFGILIVQSSAAGPVNNHFFDDFAVGNIPVDETPPSIESVTVLGPQQLDVRFDEPVELASAENPAHYALIPFNGVASAVRDAVDFTRVSLTLDLPLLNGNTYTLSVNGVQDLAGNTTTNATAPFLYFVPDTPAPGDVVLNELMVDPTPVVGQPDAEYIELFNATTDKFFDLAGWRITTLSTSATLPSFALAPGQFVVFVNNNQLPLFAGVPNAVGYTLSNTALINGGTTVTLEGPGSVVLDRVAYTTAWYRDPSKVDGGWSLERINPSAPCSDANNWRASVHPSGGSPGTQNSVFDTSPDVVAPTLLSVLVQAEDELVLVFSEPMDAGSISAGDYGIQPSLPIAAVASIADALERAVVSLSAPMTVGVVYTITLSGVTDCSGNGIGTPNSAVFGLPQPAEPGDLVINEVLYDPVGSGADFVELYNRSNKTVSLQGMQMANETNGVVGNFRTITTDPFLLLPGEFILLTPDPLDIATRYPQSRTDRFLFVNLPNYVNTRGTVVLAQSDNSVLDLFRYDDKLHFRLISKPEGYSLERVDPGRPTDDPTNWQSAADLAGRATPGFQNSQFSPAPRPTGELTIDPPLFSPDNDGYQDVLTIAYRFDQPGFVGNLTIYDAAGREARRLMENRLLGVEGAISWDGLLDNGSKGRMGPYIVVLEAYDLGGNVERFRKTVTLAHRLD